MSREVLDLLSGRHCAADVTLGIGEWYMIIGRMAKRRQLSGFAAQSDKNVSTETFLSGQEAPVKRLKY
jgi:hypothetical protein